MYSLENSKSGAVTLKYNNNYIHSKYDPEKEAVQFAKGNYCVLNRKVAIVYGIGLGYHIKAIEQILENNSMVFVFEWNCQLIKYCKEINPPIFKYKNIKIISSEDKNFYKLLSSKLNDVNDIIIHRPSLETIKYSNTKLYHLLNDFNTTKQLSQIDNTYLILGEENSKINLSKNYPNITELLNQFKKSDKPFLVVSAGPSLDSKLDLLAKVKNEFNIICVGSSLRTIMEKNIKPNAILIIDPKEIVSKQIYGYENENIPLCFPPSASKWAIDMYKGPKYIFNNKNKTDIELFATVAVSAIDVAIKSNTKQIVLIGQDLAYLGDKSHNESYKRIYGFEDKEKLGNKIITVKGVDGRMLETSQGYLIFKHKIEHLISKNSNVQFINCSEGACIEGAEYMSFDKYVKLYLSK